MRGQAFSQDEGLRLLLSRLEDLIRRSGQGEAVVGPYLTPREAKHARTYLSSRLCGGTAVLWGGYPEAERVRAVILPDYVEGLVDPVALADDPVRVLTEAGLGELAETLGQAVYPILVKGSGFRSLTHRDFLGSVLGLGLERDALGDILLPDPHTAILWTDTRVGGFLETQLERVAADTVKVTPLPEGMPLGGERRLQPISDTIASARLDCVVAALCQLSREKAQLAVRSGIVELDYEVEQACDTLVEAPSVISVRGYGKFVVQAFPGLSRKGRLRLEAGKYL